MELHYKPTDITVLKTFKDSKGNQYELRGQQNLHSDLNINKTNYYELYKKGIKSAKFEKVGSKEEFYTDLFGKFEPLTIKKEILENGEVIETSKITKQLNGYNIEHQSRSISMKGMLSFLSTKDIFNNPIVKVCIPDSININGYEKLSSMSKRVLKLLRHI